MSELYSLERHGTTALLTLNRPPANAMNHALMAQLATVLTQLAEVRALVITGHGRFFSAGLDLNEVFGYPEEQGEVFASIFDDVMTGVFALEIPVVAAINGHAIAGGAVLAAAADFRIISEGEAKIGLTEIQVGVPFPTSAFEIVRTTWTGPHLPELLYRGQNHSVAASLARHMVDEVVAPADLLPRSLALAAELGGRPRIAYASTKRALRSDALDRMAAARRARGVDPRWRQWRTPEVLEAMMAYRASLASQRPARKE